MALDLGIPPLELKQAMQLTQLHFRYTYGSPNMMPALLDSLIEAWAQLKVKKTASSIDMYNNDVGKRFMK